MQTRLLGRRTLCCMWLALLATSAAGNVYAAATERQAFEQLAAIAETKSHAAAGHNAELVETGFAGFAPGSEPPGFFLSAHDLLILPEESEKAFGRRSPVPILLVPSLRAILSKTGSSMSYRDALGNLANFPAGNIQDVVIQTIANARDAGVKVNAMLSLRRVSLKALTTRHLADHLKGANSDLRLAALFALQPYALGDDLSGVDDVGFGLPTPIVAQSLRLRRNSYDVAYVLSSVRSSGFEARAAAPLLGLLSAPEFVDSEVAVSIAKKLEPVRSRIKVEDAFMSHCISKILKKGR